MINWCLETGEKMKKIERTELWLKGHLAVFRCPVCGASFVNLEDHQLQCANHHQLNINKHGYVYFLNRGVQSGYDREMLLARRALLNAGLFDGIIDQINHELPTTSQTILDVGTGEGTPLDKLRQRRKKVVGDNYIGFDLSRDGVQLATQLEPGLFFCLADLRQLPFADQSIDVVMELFSPSDYQEFRRVLKPNGQLYKVIPTGNYLHEMRELLYPDRDQHQKYDNADVKRLFVNNYPDSKICNIQYQFAIPAELRKSMIEMSPLHWGKNVRTLSVDEINRLTSVTVDVDLLIGNQK